MTRECFCYQFGCHILLRCHQSEAEQMILAGARVVQLGLHGRKPPRTKMITGEKKKTTGKESSQSFQKIEKKDLLRLGIVLVGQYCLSHGVGLLSDLTSVGLSWLKRQAKHDKRINTSPISPQQHRLLTAWITGHRQWRRWTADRVLTYNAHLKLP